MMLRKMNILLLSCRCHQILWQNGQMLLFFIIHLKFQLHYIHSVHILKIQSISQPYFSISEVFCCHSAIIQSEILYFILYRFTVEHNLSFWKTKLFSPRKGEKDDGME